MKATVERSIAKEGGKGKSERTRKVGEKIVKTIGPKVYGKSLYAFERTLSLPLSPSSYPSARVRLRKEKRVRENSSFECGPRIR